MFHAFLCQHRQVDRFNVSCFSMSTGFALVYIDRFIVLRFFMSIFALFSVYVLKGLCNYVVIFNPDISMYIQFLCIFFDLQKDIPH